MLKRIDPEAPTSITKPGPTDERAIPALPSWVYRPLKLIASWEGVHGPNWLVVNTSATDELVGELLLGIRENPRDARRALARLENPDPYPLADVAGLADARLADIDGLIRKRRAIVP